MVSRLMVILNAVRSRGYYGSYSYVGTDEHIQNAKKWMKCWMSPKRIEICGENTQSTEFVIPVNLQHFNMKQNFVNEQK